MENVIPVGQKPPPPSSGNKPLNKPPPPNKPPPTPTNNTPTKKEGFSFFFLSFFFSKNYFSFSFLNFILSFCFFFLKKNQFNLEPKTAAPTPPNQSDKVQVRRKATKMSDEEVIEKLSFFFSPSFFFPYFLNNTYKTIL